ncbi:MAG TPA: FMN-binding protein [Treponema sp.]|nr:FMN-binding protein [Treponema sp.]
MKKKWFVLVVIFLISLCCSCLKNGAFLYDGYYTAEAAEFDDFGWKEYVTLCVSNGRIIHVEYNAVTSSGFIKSWDMDYMREMSASDGTYPNAYTRIYGGELLKHQSVEGIDCISGATHSYRIFIKLAEAALENARTGNSAIRFVEAAGNTGGGAFFH